MRQLAGLFPETEHPDLLIGLGQPDDAAVYRLDDERALIKTTDFITPIVNSPEQYGAIAAANAMSDVYAMGGEVIFCLNVAGFPETLSDDVVSQIFAGGAAKVREAGAAIAGGHTVTNPEPFYGLSVTGLVKLGDVMRKGGAKPGDQLFLTKPLGTGIVTTTAKLTAGDATGTAQKAEGETNDSVLDPAHLQAAIASMSRLNRDAARAARNVGVRGATDITGYGLLGHASEMAIASGEKHGAGLRIRASKVPLLPGVGNYIEAGYLTRGSTRNPEHYGEHVRLSKTVANVQRKAFWEAETSGGLLLAVPADRTDEFQQMCERMKLPVWQIGEVIEGTGVEVV